MGARVEVRRSRDAHYLTDSLARLASSQSPGTAGTLVKGISKPSVMSDDDTVDVRTSPGVDAPKGAAGILVAPLEYEELWIHIRMYLQDQVLPK